MNEFRDHIARVLTFLPWSSSATTPVPFADLSLWYDAALFEATVAASETYNTALEHDLHDSLGVGFTERGDIYRPAPLQHVEPDHRRGLGCCDGRSGAHGHGGAPLHLAGLACGAEAQRQIRVADRLVAEVLNTRSISLTSTDDAITEPVPLRRIDGSSTPLPARSCSPPSES